MLDLIPSDVISIIIGMLDERSLLALLKVNKHLSSLVSSHRVWRDIVLDVYDLINHHRDGLTWLELYREICFNLSRCKLFKMTNRSRHPYSVDDINTKYRKGELGDQLAGIRRWDLLCFEPYLTCEGLSMYFDGKEFRRLMVGDRANGYCLNATHDGLPIGYWSDLVSDRARTNLDLSEFINTIGSNAEIEAIRHCISDTVYRHVSITARSHFTYRHIVISVHILISIDASCYESAGFDFNETLSRCGVYIISGTSIRIEGPLI